mmetsp:Transcript_13050/g.29652  ORF Transcript_13050/g.29652 Transcript_13050/m.29652 type:complete len:301 (+) Transcript_13050:107-1009(+)
MFKPFDDIDVGDNFVLPEGDHVRGQLLFKKHCVQCHTIRRDGLNPYGALNGPNLCGIIGRTAAQNQRTGWAAYSPALKASGILWTERNMMAFLKNPRMFAGGVVNMNFRGMESFQDRVDLIHYLKKAGHEEWMVRDGSPHTQKGWWQRGGAGSASYREVHMSNQQLKPWQHLYRGARKRVAAQLERLGWESCKPSQASSRPDSHEQVLMQDEEAELQAWRRIKKVATGVKSAEHQQGFDWPPPQVIASGPIRQDTQEGMAMPEEGGATAEGYRAPSGVLVYKECGGPLSMQAAPKPSPKG